MKTRRTNHLSILILAMALHPGCGNNPAEVEDELPDADLRVLFVGNSLTYANDLPAMVQTIAEAAGHTLAQGMVASPDFSLEDHWRQGVEANIRAAKADVVVMQQGPSSLPESQEYLTEWTEVLAPVIREAEGVPALYMVWPDASRTHAFDAVQDSYRGAADAVNGLFMPAGLAWVFAWERDPELDLYGPDGFHPSTLGSAVAALTIYRVLFNEKVSDLPSRMVPDSPGLPVVDLGEHAETILMAVEQAVETDGRADPGVVY